MLIKVLQTGAEKDSYPVKRLHPSPEFLLRSDYIMWKVPNTAIETATATATEGHSYGCEKNVIQKHTQIIYLN